MARAGKQTKAKAPRSPRKPARLTKFAGLIRFLLLLGLIGFLIGFVVFARSVSKAAPPASLPKADGIVVLTGGGGRLATGGELLAGGFAERLLVTGVSREVSEQDLQTLLSVGPDILDCCIDIDIQAEDTVGNARETAVWTRALGYEHIILVTSDYHMPRAKLELTTATGGIRITPYPVSSQKTGPLWKDKDRLSLLWREYAKLLVIYLRDTGARPDQPPAPLPAPEDVMKDAQDPPKITGPKTPPIDETDTP